MMEHFMNELIDVILQFCKFFRLSHFLRFMVNNHYELKQMTMSAENI